MNNITKRAAALARSSIALVSPYRRADAASSAGTTTSSATPPIVNSENASGIRGRLVGCWRLVGYDETPVDGWQTARPLGDNPLGTILYTPDGYMSAQLGRPGPSKDDQWPDAYYIAYSGPYDVDEEARTVAHHVQVSVIPSWLGTTQLRRVQFPEPGALVLSTSEPQLRDGVLSTVTISWSRQPPR